MFLRIETIPEKKLAGIHAGMTLANDTTPLLWKSFMQRRREITNNVDGNLISMQVFTNPPGGTGFDIHEPFTKWASVEVSDFDNLPPAMEAFLLPAGEYAVFLHKSGPAKAAAIFGYIYGTWLPASGYQLDHRPHFEVLGEKYKGNEPESEEEIWIPVKR